MRTQLRLVLDFSVDRHSVIIARLLSCLRPRCLRLLHSIATTQPHFSRNMDEVSRDLEKAEIDASHPGQAMEARNEPALSPSRTSSSLGSISSSSSSDGAVEPIMSRIQTSYTLERHPTALSRIATQRSQHSGTVGATLRSRASNKPLPPFGAGKSYPPPLPAKEAYVVEFDGPDDPLHPQNWPTKKKYKSILPRFMLFVPLLIFQLFQGS